MTAEAYDSLHETRWCWYKPTNILYNDCDDKNKKIKKGEENDRRSLLNSSSLNKRNEKGEWGIFVANPSLWIGIAQASGTIADACDI